MVGKQGHRPLSKVLKILSFKTLHHLGWNISVSNRIFTYLPPHYHNSQNHYTKQIFHVFSDLEEYSSPQYQIFVLVS